MKRSTLLVYGAALAAVTGSAFAGEDSTHRWHGVGPAWYEVEGGLRRFAAGDPYEANPKRHARRRKTSPTPSALRGKTEPTAGRGKVATNS